MTLNKQLLAAVVNQIITYPETHNQNEYHCGTSHCVAGWTQVLGHGPMLEYPANVWDDAADQLGLSPEEAHYLFLSGLTIPEIHRRASELIIGEFRIEYDKYGYDRYGRGRDGYDLDGRDRDGNSLPLLVVDDE